MESDKPVDCQELNQIELEEDTVKNEDIIQDKELENEIDEEEDAFTSLGAFANELLALFSSPPEQYSVGKRQPKPLLQEGCDSLEALKLLQDLMCFDDEEIEVTYGVSPLDHHGCLSVMSHALAAVVTTLDQQHLRRLTTRIVSDTCLWVSRLFRYFDATAFFHDDIREGLIRVSRMLLHMKYPKFAFDGFQVIYARPPVIYASSTIKSGLPQYISVTLGLGSSCVRIVPCNTVIGSPVAMDTAALERMMAEDLNAQKKPFLVIANAGGGLVGGIDNVATIQELCHKNEVWLHVEGHALAALTLPNAPNLPAKVGDSVTLPLSMWLGIPSLPSITLYRTADMTAAHAAGLTSLNYQVRLSCLPLWLNLQTLGQNGITERLQHAFEMSHYLQKQLIDIPTVKLYSPLPTADCEASIKELISKPVSTAQLLESVRGVIVFQYVMDKSSFQKNSEYYDSLNSWLGQVVHRDAWSLPLEIVQVESHGLALRWSPLEGPDTFHITFEHIDQLVSSLRIQIDILNVTVKQREKFAEIVVSIENLEMAEIPGWAGLGGVRYLPDVWASHESLPDSAKEDVNALNSCLVSQLKMTDSAFSLGEAGDGMNCIRFGMVTADTNVQELVALVLNTGKEIENSSKFLDQMTEVVKKGIETATADLQRENEDRLLQEGILRHVPLVGSVYNWFIPPPNLGVRGRTLDLTAGVLESTENIYKYHMQIRHGSAPSGVEDKMPPAPSVMTTVSQNATSHSRTSSNTSSNKPNLESSKLVQEMAS